VSPNDRLRPIPVFAAATRAVREADVPEAVKCQAFDALEALASTLSGMAGAAAALEKLMALAAACPELNGALAPHAAPLRAVVSSSIGRDD
jgi:hypothetical protein